MTRRRAADACVTIVLVAWLSATGAWVGAALDAQTDIGDAFSRSMCVAVGVGVLAPLFTRILGRTPEQRRARLHDVDRATVDDGLATGRPSDRPDLRSVQRAIARQRLDERRPDTTLITVIGLATVAPYAAMLFAAHRPAWLVALTVALTLAFACFLARAWPHRRPELSPGERERLRTLARRRA